MSQPTPKKRLIHGLDPAELTQLCHDFEEPGYRAAQLQHWLYQSRVTDWSDMRNVPARFRTQLAKHVSLTSAVAVDIQGEPGDTRKILVELQDGEQVEAVLIPAGTRDSDPPTRRTVCVSSQVGCRFRCAFCASGHIGLRRQLEAAEIVGQVLLAAATWGQPPTHVVLMGIGEPFDNYDAVMKAVRIVNHPDMIGIGARRITISTCGIIPGIERLAHERLQVELSVSLHAVDDALRSRLMPVNRQYPLARLLDACRAYAKATKRIVTFEYTLIGGVNDTPSHADTLVRRLSTLPCRVNLIPLSPIIEFDGAPPEAGAAAHFIVTLEKAGINATLRASRGSPIHAACGQLRASRQNPSAPCPSKTSSVPSA